MCVIRVRGSVNYINILLNSQGSICKTLTEAECMYWFPSPPPDGNLSGGCCWAITTTAHLSLWKKRKKERKKRFLYIKINFKKLYSQGNVFINLPPPAWFEYSSLMMILFPLNGDKRVPINGMITFTGWLRKGFFCICCIDGRGWAPNTSWYKSLCIGLLQGSLAEPETQLLALIDFWDREDFPVRGHTPSNRLRSLLARKGALPPWSNGTFKPVCWRAGWLEALATPAQQSFTVEEPNCTRRLQTPQHWQLSIPFRWAGLEECITHSKIKLEAQTKVFFFFLTLT